MIEVENLTKKYGDFTAIEGVTFNVNEGEVIGFLGPNAAGKTTTMRILTCFMPATDGSAKVAGYDILQKPLEVRKSIGYLPENVPLYTEMTIESYIDFMAKIRDVPRSIRREKVNSVIEACGLEKFRTKLIGKLSKGYRQRVGLAQSLVHNPKVLILDEPTIGLDPRQIIEIRNLIKGLGGEHTVILSTHILPEASMICNRIIVINEGKIAGEVKLRDGKVITIESKTTDKITDLDQSGNIYLKVRAESDRLIARLKLIPQVIDVILDKEDGDISTYFVIHETGADIQAELASTIVYSSWSLLELRPVEMTLEEAFLELIRENVSEDIIEELQDNLDQDDTDNEQSTETASSDGQDLASNSDNSQEDNNSGSDE